MHNQTINQIFKATLADTKAPNRKVLPPHSSRSFYKYEFQELKKQNKEFPLGKNF